MENNKKPLRQKIKSKLQTILTKFTKWITKILNKKNTKDAPKLYDSQHYLLPVDSSGNPIIFPQKSYDIRHHPTLITASTPKKI